jgi:NAD(P)-dependent dehydrogenase (short-subunit alcohol dehydrogenase family)
MSAELKGSVALVTGGGRGLGRVIAEALAGAGAAVGIIGRSPDTLAETVRAIERAGGVAAAACADVTDEPSIAVAVDELRRRLGPVDVLVNNAGVCGPIGPLWTAPADEWWRTIEINLRGVVACTRLVLPDMIARGRGRILNITSHAGVFRWPGVSAYAVAKSAVIKLTENLAAELRRDGVSVLSVHPGLQPIGLTEAALASDVPPGSAEGRVADWLRGELDRGRGADPDRAAGLIVRLASGRGDGLSGRHLSVHDDLDVLIERLEEIRREDLCTLRLREAPLRPAYPTAEVPVGEFHRFTVHDNGEPGAGMDDLNGVPPNPRARDCDGVDFGQPDPRGCRRRGPPTTGTSKSARAIPANGVAGRSSPVGAAGSEIVQVNSTLTWKRQRERASASRDEH